MKGQRLNLRVSGLLWQRSLVMQDVETASLWSQLLGECMEGKLKGTQLSMLPSDMTTWKAWHDRHPDTTVLNLSRTHGAYKREFYRRPDRFVLGWLVDRQPYSCSFAVLQQHPVLNLQLGGQSLVVTFDPDSTSARLYESNVDGQRLLFDPADADRMRDTQTGTLWQRSTGEGLQGPLKGTRLLVRVGIVSYASAWDLFHPDNKRIESAN